MYLSTAIPFWLGWVLIMYFEFDAAQPWTVILGSTLALHVVYFTGVFAHQQAIRRRLNNAPRQSAPAGWVTALVRHDLDRPLHELFRSIEASEEDLREYPELHFLLCHHAQSLGWIADGERHAREFLAALPRVGPARLAAYSRDIAATGGNFFVLRATPSVEFTTSANEIWGNVLLASFLRDQGRKEEARATLDPHRHVDGIADKSAEHAIELLWGLLSTESQPEPSPPSEQESDSGPAVPRIAPKTTWHNARAALAELQKKSGS
jgi:hypothetical protein